jgi:hypothetical protein
MCEQVSLIIAENYGRVIEDCKQAIKLDADNIKAYWRAAKASLALHKLPEAIEFCNGGLLISLPINEQANSRKETRTTRHYRMKDQKHKRH